MNILKGIGAVLAGIVFIVATHTLTDLVLEKLGIFTPPEQGFHITWMVVTAHRVLEFKSKLVRRPYAKDHPILVVR
jgi:hypothetical protein